jgi:DNA processing protein
MRIQELTALHALALQSSKEIKPAALRSVLLNIPYLKIGSIEELKNYLESNNKIHLFPKDNDWNNALSILEKNKKFGIESLSIASNEYPKYLRDIDDAPPVLHIRGNKDCLNRLPGVAVVGARKITSNGKKITTRIASFLAERNWCIVSGLALGIDAAAHEAALSTNIPASTIAVLAHGLEAAKPATNKKLAENILNAGGLWVSEYPIGTPAKPHQFVARNRIQIGLSVGSIIVEADIQSGSITQAKFCLKQNRPLYAVVPHDKENSLNLLCAGTLMLVNELSANPLSTKEDYPLMLEKFERQQSIMDGFNELNF